MAEEAVDVLAKVPAEAEEEIVRIDRGHDRYRTKIVEPYQIIVKETLLT